MTVSDTHEVLVVGWYPAGDDSFAGRFIADQVAALGATGRVRSTVATFENVPLAGDDRLRRLEEDAIDLAVGRAARAGRLLLAEGAFGAPGVPIARLGEAAGAITGLGPAHQEIHRARSLTAFVAGAGIPWQLVHGHVGYPEGAAAAAAAAVLDVPFILTEHATYLATFFADRALRERYLATARAAARIVPVSRVLGAELIAEFPELEPRIVPIPNTVAIEAFRLVPIDERRPDELLWVGYRKPVKGIDTLLRAFRIVHAARPELRLRLVGRASNPTEDAGWQRLAAELGLTAAVDFDEPADRAGVAAAMARATLFVHPSNRETFGVVAVEALSTGLPVVACDSGGVTEVFGDDPGQFGAVVPAKRPEALAAAILATLERRTGFDPQAMRAAMEARFGTPAVAGRIADLYDEVLDEQRTAGDGRGRQSAVRSAVGPAPAPAPAAEGTDRPRYLVIGFQRTVLDRYLAAAPAWVVHGAEVITTGGPLEVAGIRRVSQAAVGTDRRVVELVRWGLPPTGPQSLTRRLRRIALWPLRLARTVRRRAWLERSVLEELDRTLATALLAAEPVDAGRSVVLVCIGGLDHLVARRFGEAGAATIAPGGLRWLADVRWLSPGSPQVESPSTRDR